MDTFIFYTFKHKPYFSTLGNEDKNMDVYPIPTNFLMAKKGKLWFYANSEGEIIPDDYSDLYYTYELAVKDGTYIAVEWPENWKPLKE